MGEHKRPRRLSQSAEELAKEIALEIILGQESTATVKDLDRPRNVDAVFSVSFDQVWRPIKTALLAADRGILVADIEVVGESMPIRERPN